MLQCALITVPPIALRLLSLALELLVFSTSSRQAQLKGTRHCLSRSFSMALPISVWWSTYLPTPFAIAAASPTSENNMSRNTPSQLSVHVPRIPTRFFTSMLRRFLDIHYIVPSSYWPVAGNRECLLTTPRLKIWGRVVGCIIPTRALQMGNPAPFHSVISCHQELSSLYLGGYGLAGSVAINTTTRRSPGVRPMAAGYSELSAGISIEHNSFHSSMSDTFKKHVRIPDANKVVAKIDENSRPEGGRWGLVLHALLNPSPGRTLDEVYRSLGKAAEKQANRVAYKLGLGPHVVANKIKASFGNGEERVQQLELLRSSVPPKLEKRCSKLMKYTQPTESGSTQCQAFKEIVDLVTFFPRLRVHFVFTKYLDDVTSMDDISALWNRPTGFPDNDWTFRQIIAATCLADNTSSAMIERSSIADLTNCQQSSMIVQQDVPSLRSGDPNQDDWRTFWLPTRQANIDFHSAELAVLAQTPAITSPSNILRPQLQATPMNIWQIREASEITG
ncbi:hypothetical protein B0H19DRAFT_1313389 [Mycena capillaripes]|nr:hypothetical protein B0H19DRAFT_1313389 [Mycena capillaripes]